MGAPHSSFHPLLPLIETPIGNVHSTLAVLLVLGLGLGKLAQWIRLPSVSGNIVAGLLLGPLFGLVDTASDPQAARLEPINLLALALISIGIGSHLKFRLLHNAMKRIMVIVAVESVLVPSVVFAGSCLALRYSGIPDGEVTLYAFGFAVLSLATAPATIVHVIKESKASGVFVKTLVAVVVLNNVVNIFLFECIHAFVFEVKENASFLQVLTPLLWSAALGMVVAYLLMLSRRYVFSSQRSTTFSFTLFIIAYGVSTGLGLSPLITNLSLGVTLANFSDRNELLDIFEDFEEVIYALFFTMIGTHLDFSNLSHVGVLSIAYLFFRMLGNMATVTLSRRLTPLPVRVNKYLGLALTPQAGITIGLIVAMESIPSLAPMMETVTPVMITAVTLSEILGPIFLRWSLKRTREEGQAEPRLIDFIEEEYITCTLKARDPEGVIRELVDFLYRTHDIQDTNRESFLQSVLDNELKMQSGRGRGFATPFGQLSEGNKIMGVMGVVSEGLDWDSPDDKSVYTVILMAAAPEKDKQLSRVMETIATFFARRSVVQRGLNLALTPAAVYEELACEEFVSLNKVVREPLLSPSS